MKYIVSLSGGLGSLEALKRTIERYGKDNIDVVFADVKGSGTTHFWNPLVSVSELLHERFGGESRDLYRFLWQIAYYFDIPIVRLEDPQKRSIWAVIGQKRAFRLYAGNGFVHFCSEALKRQQIERYIKTNYKPGEYAIVLGMGYDEEHRVKTAQSYWRHTLGWDVEVLAPNTDTPLADNCYTEKWLTGTGIEIPLSYTEGFEHNNCNGGCIAAGQGHFANLYRQRPEVYQYWAWMEYSIQQYLGKNVSILKVERDGDTRPLSLIDFTERIKVGDYRKQDFGGCGCFTGQATLFDMTQIPIERIER